MKTIRKCTPVAPESAVVSIYPSSLRHGPTAHAPSCEIHAFDDCGLDLALRLDDGDMISIALARSVVEQLRDALREIDSRLHAQRTAHRAGFKCAEWCLDCAGDFRPTA